MSSSPSQGQGGSALGLIEPPPLTTARAEPEPVADPGLQPRALSDRAMAVLGSLLFASVVCVGMVFLRARYVGRLTHTYIVWNLILAWIPSVFAFAAYRFHLYKTRRRVLFAFCALTWFFFFPNAPYIITDFVHLDPDHPRATVMWIDLFSIASFAWTGLCLGYVSLCLMQEIVRARFGRAAGWGFVVPMLALSSLGMYMGRCLRWNSWDVLRHPLKMFRQGWTDDISWVQPEMKVFLLMTFLFLLLSYGTMHAMAHLHGRRIE